MAISTPPPPQAPHCPELLPARSQLYIQMCRVWSRWQTNVQWMSAWSITRIPRAGQADVHKRILSISKAFFSIAFKQSHRIVDGNSRFLRNGCNTNQRKPLGTRQTPPTHTHDAYSSISTPQRPSPTTANAAGDAPKSRDITKLPGPG